MDANLLALTLEFFSKIQGCYEELLTKAILLLHYRMKLLVLVHLYQLIEHTSHDLAKIVLNKFLLFQEDGETPTARGQKIINNTPMGEFGKPEDLKGAVKFLAGPESRFVTGIVLPVDGGFSAFSGV